MANRAVHWEEGMFLRPQQFQAAERYAAEQRARGQKWDLHYNWGLRSIEIDPEALANQRLVVHRLLARLRDGTLVELPTDAAAPEVDLKPYLEQERSLKVFLALPELRVGRANVGEAGQLDGGRYFVDTLDLEDENTGQTPQAIRVRLFNARFLVSTHANHPGYETLPIAWISKGDDADNTPRIDKTYIPPVLACDAWQPLQIGILRSVYDRLGTRISKAAEKVLTRGISLESRSAEDSTILYRLRIYNEAYTILGVLAFADGVHPLQTYTELCRLVGQLAIFAQDRRPPSLPRYDHDDLGGCFYAVLRELDVLLEEDPEEWIPVPFVGRGKRMEVRLQRDWLEPAWQMFVGVDSTLTPEQTTRLLTRRGVLDMKLGSSTRVDDMYREGSGGLDFAQRDPPRTLETPRGRVYFQVNRKSEAEEWQHVQQSLTLAIRLKQPDIRGTIDGQQGLTISHNGQNAALRFTLFLTRSAITAPAASPAENG
jgi:type VI secretion system protein ImpJ